MFRSALVFCFLLIAAPAVFTKTISIFANHKSKGSEMLVFNIPIASIQNQYLNGLPMELTVSKSGLRKTPSIAFEDLKLPKVADILDTKGEVVGKADIQLKCEEKASKKFEVDAECKGAIGKLKGTEGLKSKSRYKLRTRVETETGKSYNVHIGNIVLEMRSGEVKMEKPFNYHTADIGYDTIIYH